MNALAWKDFANATPRIAGEGDRLLHQFGIEFLVERALFTTWLNPRQPETRPVCAKWAA